jgi:hypothetical protein
MVEVETTPYDTCITPIKGLAAMRHIEKLSNLSKNGTDQWVHQLVESV